MIHAFGDFTGGRLQYWADDEGHVDLAELDEATALEIDLKDGIVLFDGLRAHAVRPFVGERFSIIYFTVHGTKL